MEGQDAFRCIFGAFWSFHQERHFLRWRASGMYAGGSLDRLHRSVHSQIHSCCPVCFTPRCLFHVSPACRLEQSSRGGSVMKRVASSLAGSAYAKAHDAGGSVHPAGEGRVGT